ncbi:MAG: tagatose 1,6-diphosphate aldolase, partial [Fusobacteriales bacterium]|nr:tagatose 1,6-diphosphate aldolase [Fusobacteriales bacterium]
YDATEAGRLPDLIDDLSALRIKGYGANAVKLLIYYDPDEPAEINDIKHAFIERAGAECKGIDIPFFLEPVTYDSKIADAKSIEYARIKPRKVKNTIKEFTKPQYGIDVLKLEVPINLHFTEGYTDGEIAYTKKESIKYFQEAADFAALPFIYLSAGVTAEQFRETIKLAAEAETPFSGVLCGRATWQNGVKVYIEKGLQGLTEWLRTEGKQNVLELNNILEKSAVPWWNTYGGLEKIEVK